VLELSAMAPAPIKPVLRAIRFPRLVTFHCRRAPAIIHVNSRQDLDAHLPRRRSPTAVESGPCRHSKALSKKGSPKGVRVVLVSPGWVDTAGTSGSSGCARQNATGLRWGVDKLVLESLGCIPLGRPAKPEEYFFGTFLSSPLAASINRDEYVSQRWDGANGLTLSRAPYGSA